MNEVPTMISTKDLAYIEDMLNWNFITIKKINCYINKVSDNDVKELLISVSEKYKTHYNNLLSCLNLEGIYDEISGGNNDENI